MRELTAKQKRFCDQYLIDLNATQAAIRAGYSRQTAKEIGYEHLTKPHIQAYIERQQEELQVRTQITIKWVLAELKESYERCSKEKPILDSKGNETGMWRFDAPNAIRCLELIGKHLGMFNERAEVKPIEANASEIRTRFFEELSKLALEVA